MRCLQSLSRLKSTNEYTVLAVLSTTVRPSSEARGWLLITDIDHQEQASSGFRMTLFFENRAPWMAMRVITKNSAFCWSKFLLVGPPPSSPRFSTRRACLLQRTTAVHSGQSALDCTLAHRRPVFSPPNSGTPTLSKGLADSHFDRPSCWPGYRLRQNYNGVVPRQDDAEEASKLIPDGPPTFSSLR